MKLRKRVRAGLLAAAASAVLGGASCSKTPRRDSVTIALPYEVTTLDPHAAFTLSNLAILMNSYEALVSTDAEMRISPCLAERWENPDLETWIFHLRRNVRFHSGKLLDSRDVVYSFNRLLTRRDLQMSGYLISVRSVDALDPATVRIRTARPLAVLLNKTAGVAIVPDGSTDETLASKENGTGPYRIRRLGTDSIELERNDLYWGPRPAFRTATYRLATDPPRALALIRSRGANLVQCNSRAAAALARPRGRFRIVRRPDLFLKHLAYELGREFTPGVSGGRNPFRDIRVRRALDLAIDRDALVAALPAPAAPASQLAPPFVFGFDPSIVTPRPDRPEAKRLLKEAGYPNGFDVQFDVRRIFEPAATLVAAQLAAVGVRANLHVYSDREFSGLAVPGAKTLILDRFGCTTGDIGDIFDNVVHSADAARHFGIFNSAGYSNREIDRQIEESAGIMNTGARREALQKIVRRVMDDLVLLPLYVDEDIYAVDRSLDWRPRNDGMVLAAEIHPAG